MWAVILVESGVPKACEAFGTKEAADDFAQKKGRGLPESDGCYVLPVVKLG